MSNKLRVVVLGMMGRCPFGGQTWLYLNWLCGLRKLGHDVWYVEDDSVWPYDPEQNTVTDDCRYALRHLAGSLERIGLAGKWAFRLTDRPGACWGGLTERDLGDLYRTSDVLLNIVGATDLREEHLAAPLRIYVETDPVTCELRLALGDEHTRRAFADHHLIFTYGENFGAPDCGVPLNGLAPKYRKTRQPIDLEMWPMAHDPSAQYFTTIGNYRQSGNDVEYNGQTYYWSKHREWERFADLPRRTSQPFELAMSPDDPRDREFLTSCGFRLVPPIPMSLDVFGAYPSYFRRSRAEFTVAKDQNVRLRSGWFSERDACYLACGKPVVTQDTGLAAIYPVGEGLFTYRTLEEAVEAVTAINADYRRHCTAARRIAEEFFAAEKVAARLLDEAGVG
jgi:glycosyl transferase family 1